MDLRPIQRTVSSYTRSAVKDCSVFIPGSKEELSELMASFYAEGRPYALMGGGNSFGDVFIPAAETVIDTTGIHSDSELNTSAETVRVSAGMRSGALSELLLNCGFHTCGSSGSLTNTVAGDISSDVNGKDSWLRGNFGENVVSMDFLTVSGQRIHVTEGHELYRGLIGGLGALGVILGVELRLNKAKSTHLSVERSVTRNLGETIKVFSALDGSDHEFAYAWVDVLCRKNSVGRAVIELARFQEDVGADALPNVFAPRQRILGLGDDAFWGLVGGTFRGLYRIGLSRLLSTWLNASRFSAAAIAQETRKDIPFADFQYPMLKSLPNWNKGISHKGMQEIQILFPIKEFGEAFHAILSILQQNGAFPFICAIRRHRAGGGMLSFAGDGLSFTVNYDRATFRSHTQCYRMERDIIALTIRHGGKVYLSKFPFITPDECAAMYSGLGAFIALKRKYDPNGLLQSAASARMLG